MADTTVIWGGNPVKLVDNGDGTFSLASKLVTESTPDAAVPTKASFVAGKYVVADPAYTDGDLAPIRTNAKGEVLTQLTGSIPGGAVYPYGATKWTAIATSSANAIATATQTAVSGKKHYCMGYLVCLRAAAAGNDFLSQIKDGTTVKFTDVVGNASPTGTRIGVSSSTPIVEGTANTDMVLTIGAAGASAITELTMWGYTV